jgi:hypothetical protein
MKWLVALAASAVLLFSATAAEARHRDNGYGYTYPPGYGAPAYPPGYAPGYGHPPAYYDHRRNHGGHRYRYAHPSYPQAYYGGHGYDQGYVRCKRRNNAGAAIVGALIGGAIGNSAADGRDRGPATVAGALIGGAIGAQAGRGKKCYYDYGYRGQPYGYGY